MQMSRIRLGREQSRAACTDEISIIRWGSDRMEEVRVHANVMN